MGHKVNRHRVLLQKYIKVSLESDKVELRTDLFTCTRRSV